jgi:nucleotide-binding universal stress UspA family protein
MTVPRIEKIGLVYDFSKQGDWALSVALQLGRTRTATLNVYHFLESPYEVHLDVVPTDLPARRYEAAILVQKERELREHLDDCLGDFEDVRLRVCESGRHNCGA